MSGPILHDPCQLETSRTVSAGAAERDLPARAMAAVMAAVMRRLAEHMERDRDRS